MRWVLVQSDIQTCMCSCKCPQLINWAMHAQNSTEMEATISIFNLSGARILSPCSQIFGGRHLHLNKAHEGFWLFKSWCVCVCWGGGRIIVHEHRSKLEWEHEHWAYNLGILELSLVDFLEVVIISDMYIKSLSICTWIRNFLRQVGRPSLGHTLSCSSHFGETK